MQLFGITLVGVNAQSGTKALLSIGLIVAVLITSAILRKLVGLVLNSTHRSDTQTKFWTRQGISLLSAIIILLGLLSIWFSDPTRLATALGLVSAGLAFALQQPVTSIASYFVILRGNTFTVGDRISMGGVRGDVIRLGLIQTTIMEMGQPPDVQSAEPAMWIKSRQFTGRIVTVSNSKIFAEPVFNYTREFPFIWEEMAIPITYKADRSKMEEIMLAAAKQHAVSADALASDAVENLKARFGIEPLELVPRVYYRLTDNWLELTVRFLVQTHLIRNVKDAMSRRIVAEMDAAGIGVASATYDIVGFPAIRTQVPVETAPSEAK
jgi:small-conductance mechanosensitive channel